MSTTPAYLKILREILESRTATNKYYSLRAFARDLDLHPAALSLILNGRRSVPLKDSKRIAKALKLDAKTRLEFLESLNQKSSYLDSISIERKDAYTLDESYTRIIAEWEYYAVLTYFKILGASSEAEVIADHFEISKDRAEEIINELISADLLRKSDSGLTLTHQRVRTTEEVFSEALQKSHYESLELAKVKLESIDVTLRDFTSLMIAIDPEKLTEMKLIIREFQQKILTLSENGNRSLVYQLAMQLYPLSATKEEK